MNLFDRLGLGSKVVVALSVVLIICMLVVTILVVNITSKVQGEEADKLLQNAAAREANLVKGIFDEVYIDVVSSHEAIEALVQNRSENSQNLIERDLINMLDVTIWAQFAYVYIKDPYYFGDNITKAKHRLNNGEFMVFVDDEDVNASGGVKVLQAEESIVNFKSVQQALQSGKQTVGSPSWQTINGKEYFGVGINQPLFDTHGKAIGVLGMFIDLATITTMLQDPNKEIFKGDFKGVYATDSTIAAHARKEFLGKYLREVNTSPTMNELKHAIENQIEGFYEYTNSLGEVSRTAVANIDIGHGLTTWTLIVSAPTSSVYESVVKLRFVMIAANIIVIIVVCLIMFFFVRNQISKRLDNVSHLLFDFFAYLNHESKTSPKMIQPRSKDELGQVVAAINENIKRTGNNIEKDAKLVEEALVVINHAKDGQATKRITLEGSNPELNTLKNSVNELLNLLSTAIGNDLQELNRVFDSFTKLDFSTKIANASGRVEVVTNTLGDEIVKMLKTSSDFAHSLSEESGKLQEAVNALTQSSNSQAHSLEETAAALEQITSSMQNVSTKTSDVITQSEEIKNV
ncbi:methyl-accepting chemotaxis protein, partial [Campylobacter sp. MIT 12-8780]|uniref:PDC sensor domain-containing protein n=2 Tax=unclassified Campylobacter TaxID=2593542 RepID=UPI00115C9DC0